MLLLPLVQISCLKHLWQVLIKPYKDVLPPARPDFPFCLCWANHTWSNGTWEKSKARTTDSILMEQRYPGVEDYKLHFRTVLPAFLDKRYMTVDGKPIFVVYHPWDLPDARQFIDTWQTLARENGLPGIHFVAMSPATSSHEKQADGSIKVVLPNLESSADLYHKVLDLGFDAVNSFGKRRGELMSKGKWSTYAREVLLRLGLNRKLVYDYPRAVKYFFAPEDRWDNVYPTIMPGYDRTARIGNGEGIFLHNTPENFKRHVLDAIGMVKDKPEERRIIFLNAWNEWGEGCYVEPDMTYGHGYLDAIRTALEESGQI